MLRARSDSDKEQRWLVFLKVAEDLFMKNSDKLPSVTEIVKEASLAKGTFYLYFKTKEEVFLDILEIRYTNWLDTLTASIVKLRSITAEDMADVMLAPVAGDACFLQLASISQTILEVNLSTDKAVAFKNNIGASLEHFAKTVHNHFGMDSKEIIFLSLECYAAIIGMWQLSQVSKTVETIQNQIPYKFLFPEFAKHIRPMLTHIIRGKLGI